MATAQIEPSIPDTDIARHKHRRVTRRILAGETDVRAIAREEKTTQKRVRDLMQELRDQGWEPASRWLNAAQVAVILGVKPRRVRTLCDEGRLGERVANRVWLIAREELLEYLTREHRTGAAGRTTAQIERGENEGES